MTDMGVRKLALSRSDSLTELEHNKAAATNDRHGAKADRSSLKDGQAKVTKRACSGRFSLRLWRQKHGGNGKGNAFRASPGRERPVSGSVPG